MRSFSEGIACVALSAAIGWTASGPSWAQDCFICDDLVVLSDSDAACFLEVYDARRKEAQRNGYATVDLAVCKEGAGNEKRGAIDKPLDPLAPQPGERALDATRSSYVLDLTGIDCLRKLVAVQPRPIDPSATFDLLKNCAAR